MPVYQYACTECSEQLEVRQSFTDDALTVCPVCEGRLRKVLNAVGVVFKGSGFYRTDSRDAATSANGTANGKDRSGSASGDSAGSSGSTPATKTADSGGSAPSSGSAGSDTGSKAAAAS